METDCLRCQHFPFTLRHLIVRAYQRNTSMIILTVIGGAPFLEVLQYQVDAWSGRSKPLFQLQVPKINLIYGPRVGDVSDIKLIRTDTTLDLSQKAEKRYPTKFSAKEHFSRYVTLTDGLQIFEQNKQTL